MLKKQIKLLFRDVELHGALDNSSAFLFENFLGVLKRKVHSGRYPLKQIVGRYSDGDADSQRISSGQNDLNISTKPPNNVYLHGNTCVEVLSEVVEDGQPLYECRKYHNSHSLFLSPIDSKLLSCFTVDNDTSIVRCRAAELSNKCFKLSLSNQAIIMGFLHSGE